MGKPSAPQPPDPTVVAGAQTAANEAQQRLNAQINRPTQTSPFGSTTWSHAGDDWTQELNLDPRILQAFFGDLGNQSALSNIGGFMADSVRSMVQDENGNYIPFLSGTQLPGMVSSVDPNQAIGEVDLSGLPGLPGQDDFGAERQRVEDALYGENTRALDPQFAEQQRALESQLTNQGFARGTEAWDKATGALDRQKTDAYAKARMDAITGGGSEQSRLFANALQARGQGVGERFQSADQYNRGAAQDFSQRFQSGQFGDAARSQALAEALQRRNQPFNEMQQVIHGNSPNIPQMSNPSQIAGMPAADVIGANAMAYNGQLNNYNTQVGARNNVISSLGRIGSAAVGGK